MSASTPKIKVQDGFDWRSFDAYLFDIDGTLLNSRGRIHYYAFSAAMRDVFKKEGTIDGVPWHGNTDVGILRAALAKLGVSDAEFAEKKEAALSVMRGEVIREAHRIEADLCPAIGDVLEELHGMGKLLGVSSGNLEVIGWSKLRAAGIASYFKFGAFSDKNHTRVEIFREGAFKAREFSKNGSSRICFVGDTPADVTAAHDVGCSVIAVSTGIHSFDELAALNPELCLGCCEDLRSAGSS